MPVATQKRTTSRTSRRIDSNPFHYDSEGRSTGTYGPQPARHIDAASAAAPLETGRAMDAGRATDAAQAVERNSSRAARKVRRHRPLQMNFVTALTGLFLLGQLVALLWLHGRALSAAHLSNELDVKIADKRNAIARTQEKIAAYDASPRIDQWARERGWAPAQQTDFDDVTNRTPVASGASTGSDAQPDTGAETADGAAETADGADAGGGER